MTNRYIKFRESRHTSYFRNIFGFVHILIYPKIFDINNTINNNFINNDQLSHLIVKVGIPSISEIISVLFSF
jgi:hypothetical protein